MTLNEQTQKSPYKRAVFHIDEWKPFLRGWIHAVTFPLTAAAGLALVVMGDSVGTRIATAVFVFTSMQLFGISALYHRFNWPEKINNLLRKLDHTNIMLIIAGTYTPLAWTLLPESSAKTLLAIVWGASCAGIIFRVFWVNAPRWLYTLCYAAVGCIALFFLPELWNSSKLVTSFIIAGGALYLCGAVVYARKKPNPSTEWFGFHEVFHAFTVAAFALHFTAVACAIHQANLGI